MWTPRNQCAVEKLVKKMSSRCHGNTLMLHFGVYAILTSCSKLESYLCYTSSAKLGLTLPPISLVTIYSQDKSNRKKKPQAEDNEC